MTLWNGKSAAISLTFDDGMVEQIQYAVPELDRMGMRGTFFVVHRSTLADEIRTHGWRAAAKGGHEIGSHSRWHKHLDKMTPLEQAQEVCESKTLLEELLSTKIVSYSYPYCAVNALVLACARSSYKQARGGHRTLGTKYITPQDCPDLHNTPCWQMNGGAVNSVPAWINEAKEKHAWLSLMFHTISPNEDAYDNVTIPAFHSMLLRLKQADVWVATYAEAAENLRQNL